MDVDAITHVDVYVHVLIAACGGREMGRNKEKL